MNVSDALRSRYSVRGYLPDPVPEATIRAVLDLARLAPSGSNTQPWHIAVVSGDACNALRTALCEDFDSGVPQQPGFARGDMFGPYRDRRRACGFGYYEAMGVARDDKEGRTKVARKNFEFFGAPHAAFFSMPSGFERNNALDMGIFLQSVMLVMAEFGLGCIPQGALASYPDTVRRFVELPAENNILCGMSFGYEDPDAHINTIRMPREPLDLVASFTE